MDVSFKKNLNISLSQSLVNFARLNHVDELLMSNLK